MLIDGKGAPYANLFFLVYEQIKVMEPTVTSFSYSSDMQDTPPA